MHFCVDDACIVYLCPLRGCRENDIPVAMSTLRALISKYSSSIKERTSWKNY